MFLKMHENWKVASAVKHIDTNQVLWKYPRSLENSRLLRKKNAASTCWSRSLADSLYRLIPYLSCFTRGKGWSLINNHQEVLFATT